jgi:NHL repeat
MSTIRSSARLLLLTICLLVPAASSSQVAFQYQFYLPFSVAVHVDAATVSVLVSERGRHRIHKYRADGTLVWRVGNNPLRGAGNNDFGGPGGLAVDSRGQIFVADTGNARVQKLSPTDGSSIGRWGSSGTGSGQFLKPIAIAVDSRDHVYVLDSEARRVQKFSNDGATNYGFWGGTLGNGDGEFSPIGGGPGDIVIDATGNAYISDTPNNRIHKWGIASDAAGNITGATFLGWLGKCVSGANCDLVAKRSRGFQCTSATCSASSPGSEDGQFTNPRGLTLDPAGNLFVADVDNNRIQMFTSPGAFARAWGSAGSGHSELRNPLDVAAEGSNAVYVADMRNGRIVKFTNAGGQQSVLGGGIAVAVALGSPPNNLDALLDPDPFFILAGETKTAKVSVWPLGQFAGFVTLSSVCGSGSPPTVGSVCRDLLTDLPAVPSGTTADISPNPLILLAGVAGLHSSDATLTVTASAWATPGKYLGAIKTENRPLDILHHLPIAFEILPAVPADMTMVPCPGAGPPLYQRGTLPEILPLAAVMGELYGKKQRNPKAFPSALEFGAAATATPGAGWVFRFEKPLGVTRRSGQPRPSWSSSIRRGARKGCTPSTALPAACPTVSS